MIEGLNESRFFVHIAARRTGKSYAAAILAFAKLLEPGQQVMVVAPNFSLSSIIWDYVTDLIKQVDTGFSIGSLESTDIQGLNAAIVKVVGSNNASNF